MIAKLAWLRIENDSILMVRTRQRDAYYLPGGKPEAGETDHEALCREIREELCVTLLPHTVQLVGVFEAQAHHKPSDIMVQLRCYTAEYEGELACAAEIEELRWLTYADRHRVSAAAQLVFDFAYQHYLLT